MTCLYLTSDLHDGHKAIGKYRNKIESSVIDTKTNREFIRDNWRATKRDTTILVGDILFGHDSHEFIESLPGRKILVAGNHDFERGSASKLAESLSAFEKITAVMNRSLPISADGTKRPAWIQHTPMHPAELRGKYCIHGHIHSTELDFMNKGTELYDSRFINVNMDVLIPRTGKMMLSASELYDYAIGNWKV